MINRMVFVRLIIAFALGMTMMNPFSKPPAANAKVLPHIVSGTAHTLLLQPDGTLWAWGQNFFGGLGDGTTDDSPIPVRVKRLAEVVDIAAGGHKSLALLSDGTVWAWGDNTYGQLGNESTAHAAIPMQVAGLTDVTAIAGGVLHAMALTSDGTVWTWGYGGNGELGNDEASPSTMSNRPTRVAGLTDVTAIFSSPVATRAYAIKSDGTAWAWGQNDFGALLGNGTTAPFVSAPVKVTELEHVQAFATGSSHTVALKSDGTVWAWGYNATGELGNGSATNSPVRTPAKVLGLSGITAIAAGQGHSLALKNDGTVWAWGANGQGQLGDGTTIDRGTAAQILGLSDVIQIAAGYTHSVALKRDGTVWAWGYNGHGQLGDASTERRTRPTAVIGLSTGADPSQTSGTGKLTPPQYIQAAMPTSEQVELTWTAVPGASYYRVYRGVDEPDPAEIASTPLLTYSDDELVPGKTYYYWITAMNATEEESEFSTMAVLETPSPPSTSNGSALTPDEAAALLQRYQIVKGDSSGDMRLADHITRAEMMTLLVRALGLENDVTLLRGAPTFSDTATHWASGYIARAHSAGFTAGFPDGTFRPDEEMTVAQAVALLVRLIGLDNGKLAWPSGYLRVADEVGILPDDLATSSKVNASITRGHVFLMLRTAVMDVPLPSGRTILQTYHTTP